MVSKTVKATNYNKNKNQLTFNLILPNAEIPEGLFEAEEMESPMLPQPPKAVYYPTKAEYVRENRRKTDNILSSMGIPPIAVGNPVMPFQSREPMMGAYNPMFGELTPMEGMNMQSSSQLPTPVPIKKYEPVMEKYESEESEESEAEAEAEPNVEEMQQRLEERLKDFMKPPPSAPSAKSSAPREPPTPTPEKEENLIPMGIQLEISRLKRLGLEPILEGKNIKIRKPSGGRGRQYVSATGGIGKKIIKSIIDARASKQ